MDLQSLGNLKKNRMIEENKFKYGLENIIIQSFIISLLFGLVILYFFGQKGCFIHLCSCFFSIILLEDINYIEHYGLKRKRIDNDNYEKVEMHHSWDANSTFTNFIIFNLQRHSDHHANSSRDYFMLRSYESSPKLPTGYGGMMVLSFIPFLYFKIMNPILENWKLKYNR